MSRGMHKDGVSSATLCILEPQLLVGWCHMEHPSFTNKIQHGDCKSQSNGTQDILGPCSAPLIPHLALDALGLLFPETFGHMTPLYSEKPRSFPKASSNPFSPIKLWAKSNAISSELPSPWHRDSWFSPLSLIT